MLLKQIFFLAEWDNKDWELFLEINESLWIIVRDVGFLYSWIFQSVWEWVNHFEFPPSHPSLVP